MRTALLTAVLLALSTQPAFAFPPGNSKPRYATLKVVNSSEQEVEVSVAGDDFHSLLPNGGFDEVSILTTHKSEGGVSVRARLPGIPESLTGVTAAVQPNKTTVATVSVTGSTVSIAVGRPGNVAKLLREAGVVLASGGGLMPLLCLGILLGRRPQCRPEVGVKPAA